MGRNGPKRNSSFDRLGAELYVVTQEKNMAENTPNPPGGALPPRAAEASKVQPKKETVPH